MQLLLKKVLLISMLLSLSAGALAKGKHDELMLERACKKTVNAYFINIDQRDPDGVAEQFADAAVLNLNGRIFNGTEAIKGFVSNSSSTPIIHHLTTSQFIFDNDKSGSGIQYVLVNTVLPAAALNTEADQKVILSGQYFDDYVIDGSDCKIAKRELKVVHINIVQ